MSTENQLPKISFSKILYVTDLSESGRHAFPYAASLAHQYGAEMTVYHVVETDELERQLIGYIDDKMWDVLKNQTLKEARETLIQRKRSGASVKNNLDAIVKEDLGEQKSPYVSYDVVVETGNPVERILHKADSEDYDLVVIARRGQGGVSGASMGSTAYRIVRRCSKPVLTVEVPPGPGSDD